VGATGLVVRTLVVLPAKEFAMRVVIVAASLFAATIIRLLRDEYVVVAVLGRSMEPTLRSGQRVLVRKSYAAPMLGDLVVFEAPNQSGSKTRKYVKRVAGLPGDRIAIAKGSQTSACWIEPNYAAGVWQIPAGYLFVASDSGCGFDSNSFGPIAANTVLGKVLLDSPVP